MEQNMIAPYGGNMSNEKAVGGQPMQSAVSIQTESYTPVSGLQAKDLEPVILMMKEEIELLKKHSQLQTKEVTKLSQNTIRHTMIQAYLAKVIGQLTQDQTRLKQELIECRSKIAHLTTKTQSEEEDIYHIDEKKTRRASHSFVILNSTGETGSD